MANTAIDQWAAAVELAGEVFTGSSPEVRRPAKWGAAADFLLRALPEGLVVPGEIATLSYNDPPADGSRRPPDVVYGHLWGVRHAEGKAGYVGLFTCDGCVRLYRVLKYKPGEFAPEGGGNDYVLVDRWDSPAAFTS